jgi:hypothetical protein
MNVQQKDKDRTPTTPKMWERKSEVSLIGVAVKKRIEENGVARIY